MLIAVAAVRAFPNQLAVILNDFDFAGITTALTVIRLGIEFGVHNVFVDVFYDCFCSLYVI